jgi:hypothetical protein
MRGRSDEWFTLRWLPVVEPAEGGDQAAEQPLHQRVARYRLELADVAGRPGPVIGHVNAAPAAELVAEIDVGRDGQDGEHVGDLSLDVGNVDEQFIGHRPTARRGG